MPAILNKQPLFTATPILISTAFDPTILDTLRNTTACTTVYTDISTYGSLITKITVSSTPRIGDTVLDKQIYLLISSIEDPSKYNVFKSAYMKGVGPMAVDNIIPYVEFTFDGGLLTKNGISLAIASTLNTGSGSEADNIIVTIEGGTYDQPSA